MKYPQFLAGLAACLRRGPDGNPKSPRAAHFDETRATPYASLPDPLVTDDGKKVASARQWWQKRRPEIVEHFDREIYGRAPANTPKVTWEVVGTQTDTVGTFRAVTKKLVGRVDNSAYPHVSVNIDLTITTPAGATAPVPVILAFGFVFPPGFRSRLLRVRRSLPGKSKSWLRAGAAPC